ncbi:MAG: PatA/PatG family cyanobactin maturation protease [Microcoleus sp. PH2017_01_SCD_O_A]|uniref:PatA/PatG family cyanobactin maturation protease n=1 Tax=unclassified Microcoleus TaxID=2642155 RepID=UPI001DF07705|nr:MULTISPECIES: PatA/PatG family cyanobactin maturation protease [unclassified Microcoleus]MCC3413902.1 PatA/PatG family cyanobactin maturation protease [Microcoleus sp. PH2017_02_FOX_O_A]MCC3416848.1 PatA/PatG family cyanobactin maturation protease [Microcoleus sp. PH2017_07_MST_O_A]MCC3535467.1 PatA/PatG family cyanobactin maturation protease [Microcoleus sp. PH2017_25_DOB_D_A]MCC3422437.1 PatA/PatG family cyanobactin maturation protease [Microcoleus sp. PH2017_01_SCD_O_A]MCC3452268.1 PatA/
MHNNVINPSVSLQENKTSKNEILRTLYNDNPLNLSVKLPEEIARAHNLGLAIRAGIQPEDYIFDAGCGMAIPAIHIAQSLPRTCFEGIAISEVEVAEAQNRIAKANLVDRIRVQVGDFHAPPFPDEVFDVAFFNDSIKYSNPYSQVLAEANRVLRPGGSLYIAGLFVKESPLSSLEQQSLNKAKEKSGVLYGSNIISLKPMMEFVEQAGFQILEYDDKQAVKMPGFALFMDQANHLYPNIPLICADIKAVKPISSKVKNSLQKQVKTGQNNLYNLPDIIQSLPKESVIANLTVDSIIASEAPSQIPDLGQVVYALGSLGYDFGTEARRDSFKQLMPPFDFQGTRVPANPYDARQMVDYLAENMSEARSLIWTLNIELTPVYAIAPTSPFAADAYRALHELLSGQIQAEGDAEYVERVSLPGILTGKQVKLYSGQVIPVLELIGTRGLYGWKVNNLVNAAMAAVQAEGTMADEGRIRQTLDGFLNRIYYDLRNLGTTSQDRALNFSVTNAFQAAQTFSQAVAVGMELDSITVDQSPFRRIDSDCWDVKLKFFDPENSRRAKKIFRFTVDVSDLIPVTLGEVRSWSSPY